MYYEFEITVPTTATEDDPEEIECILNHGILHYISLSFPAGVHRVIRLQVLYQEWQLFPNNLEEALSADDYTIEFKEYFPIIEKPYTIKVRGWNNGGSYPHTIRIGFGILPTKTAGAPGVSELTEEELLGLVGEYEMIGE